MSLYKNLDGEDLLYTAAKYRVLPVVEYFLNLGINPLELSGAGVCAEDLISKSPELSLFYQKYKKQNKSLR